MKIMKILMVLIFLSSLLLVQTVEAEETITKDWEVTIDIDKKDSAWDIESTKEGNYIVVGSSEKSNSEIYAWLLKLDKNGEEKWRKEYSNGEKSILFSLVDTNDDKFVAAGTTKKANSNNEDIWVIKIDSEGNLIWNRTFGGELYDIIDSIQECDDGGFILTGSSSKLSSDREIIDADILLLRLDEKGDKVWSRKFTELDIYSGDFVIQTDDSGFLIVGYTNSEDLYLLKTDKDGFEQWNKTYGGTGNEKGYCVKKTEDDGFIIVGDTESYTPKDDWGDLWLIKTDSNGDEKWNKTYGGKYSEEGYDLQKTDNGYLILGEKSFSGYWLLKVDKNGNMLWNKTFEIEDDQIYEEKAKSIESTEDNSYILLGNIGNLNEQDIWMIKTSLSDTESGDENLENNGEDESGTPGFEFILLIVVLITITLLVYRRKN
ncbi:MAG: Heimdall-CTERM domain-containing surface protein [Candidatus Thermoplasmatota archaeon]